MGSVCVRLSRRARREEERKRGILKTANSTKGQSKLNSPGSSNGEGSDEEIGKIYRE